MKLAQRIVRGGLVLTALCAGLGSSLWAQDATETKRELQELREQNRLLQNQLQQQQQMIDQLNRKFSGMEKTNELRDSDWRAYKADTEGTNAPPKSGLFALGNVAVTGEGAAGFFDTESKGAYPNAPFRFDEARLFFDAPVWDDVYFHAQVDLTTPQAPDDGLYMGEFYLEFENLTKRWGVDDLLNVRLGRMYIPFGEEYQERFAIDDPLISHSLSDLWGYDTGIEAYGSWRKFSYVAAVQNGGILSLNDNTADKSITGRIGYNPLSWLHFSASGIRIGNLSAANDVSALWFGNGLFQSIGTPGTSLFRVSVAEFDASAKWKSGYVKGAGGYASYDDNDPAGGNHRDIYYYYLEALQHVTPKLYAAARLSQIRAAGGYLIVGDSPTFGLPTSDIWRLSLGLGYQLNSHLVLKAEYMFEQGQLSTGGPRNHENMFATEAAFKF